MTQRPIPTRDAWVCEMARPDADAATCPTLGSLACQRQDPHRQGHVYVSTWVPDRHDQER